MKGYKATLAGGENSLMIGDNGSIAKGKKERLSCLLKEIRIITYSISMRFKLMAK